MNTKIIEYVIAIAEERSLSKAASRLYISQPALSQRLKKLEQEIGAPLFRRDKDGLTITDAGRVYINGGRSILKIKEDAYRHLKALDANTITTLRFGCACMQGLQSVSIFRNTFPDTELTVMNTTTPIAQTALLTGRLDLAMILTHTLKHEFLEYLPLTTSRMYLAIPDGHPILQTDTITDHLELLRDDYFILSKSPSFSGSQEEEVIRSWSFQPRVLCETNDNISRHYMLNQGLGISFIHDYAIQPDHTYHVFPLENSPDFYIVAAYPRYTPLSQPAKEMIKIWLTLFEK